MPLTVSEIAPRQALVLGDVSKENTPPLYINTDGWTPLVGTKSSIALKCNGETIDSLYYSASPDSVHTNVVPTSAKNGISTQLVVSEKGMEGEPADYELSVRSYQGGILNLVSGTGDQFVIRL
jgi:hypothetical protein